jgi:hypothetical protein
MAHNKVKIWIDRQIQNRISKKFVNDTGAQMLLLSRFCPFKHIVMESISDLKGTVLWDFLSEVILPKVHNWPVIPYLRQFRIYSRLEFTDILNF